MLEVSKEEIVTAAQKYLLEPLLAEHTSKVIFGAKNEDVDKNLIANGWIYEDFNNTTLRRDQYDGSEDTVTW